MRRVFVIAVLACAMAACDEAPPAKTPPETSNPAPAKSKVAELPAQMVAAVSSGKTSEMISVHFVLEAAPAIGRPLPVEIAIVAHRPFASVRALFEAPDTLGISAGNQFEQQKNVDAEAVLKHKLVLQPSQEGVFLVTAAVETEGEDGVVTRIYSIPVIIHAAGATTKPAANPAPGPSAG